MSMSIIMSDQQIYDIRYAYHVSGESLQNLSFLHHINEETVRNIVFFKGYVIREHIFSLLPYWKKECERDFSEMIYGKLSVPLSEQQSTTFFTDERIMKRWMKVKYPSIYQSWAECQDQDQVAS